jgi:hypothetical protein
MQEDEAYLKDFGLSTPNFIQLDKLHEEAQDVAQKLAQENVEKKKQIEELAASNQELQTEFAAKQAELRELVEQHKQKQAGDIASLIKVMSQRTNELSKESNLILRKFKRGEISAEDYIKEYKIVKTKHSQANYTYLALQAKQQQIQHKAR